MGKTIIESSDAGLHPKHPHARGEDYDKATIAKMAGETPPRTWGRPLPFQPPIQVVGNTPTHVGKTGPNQTGWVDIEKHPHARGEDLTDIKEQSL